MALQTVAAKLEQLPLAGLIIVQFSGLVLSLLLTQVQLSLFLTTPRITGLKY